MRGRRHLIRVAVVTAVAAASPASACVPAMPPAPLAGESEEAFHARVHAELIATQSYANASKQERTAIDQARWWNEYPMIFLARVERLRIAGRAYGIPKPQSARPRYAIRHGRRIPLPPPVLSVPPPPLTLDLHQAYLRPVFWIKGELAFAASWQDVGGLTSCGSTSDGDLGYAYPGDRVIVFAKPLLAFDHVQGKMTESKDFALLGIKPDEAADPRITEALRASGILTDQEAAN